MSGECCPNEFRRWNGARTALSARMGSWNLQKEAGFRSFDYRNNHADKLSALRTIWATRPQLLPQVTSGRWALKMMFRQLEANAEAVQAAARSKMEKRGKLN